MELLKDNVKECLVRAKALLVDNDWCKAANGMTSDGRRVKYNDEDAVAFDLDGALKRASGMTQTQLNMYPADPQFALYTNLLKAVLPHAQARGFHDVVAFNDCGDTSKTDVLRVLNDAIRARKNR